MEPIEELKSKLRTMKREDIENLVLDKIIESVKAHSSVGELHRKLMDSTLQKDRLFNRVNNLNSQVLITTK